MSNKIPYKTYLSEQEMPKHWLNLKAFMKEQHAPFLNPSTGAPCTAEELEAVFCKEYFAFGSRILFRTGFGYACGNLL